MRKHQIGITINSYGDGVPKKLQEQGATSLEIKAYADANNIYEALAAAYHEALTAIGKHDGLPSFGRKEHTQKAYARKSVMDKGGETVFEYKNSEGE